MSHKDVKEVDHNCRPKVITVEVGPRYGDITNYQDQRIAWQTERLGHYGEHICTWNPENQRFKSHWFGMDVRATANILDILVDLGVIP